MSSFLLHNSVVIMHSIPTIHFLTYPSNRRATPRHSGHTIFPPALTMSINKNSIKKNSIGRVRKEDLSRPRMLPITHLGNSGSSDLRFNRLQPSNDDLDQPSLEFGNFVAREAILDEELWVAAFLKTECHWENRKIGKKYLESYKADFECKVNCKINCKVGCKVDYANREFNALKMRSKGELGQTNKCVVAVMKENPNVKCNVIKSVVGTLDFSIRQLLQGESFPGEGSKFSWLGWLGWLPFTKTKYVYISNLCIRLSSRRQSIASNMLRFVIESARLSGIASIYVHVHRNNEPAVELYKKLGFQVVEKANSELLKDDMYLLCYRA